MPDGCKDSLLPSQEYAPKIRVRVRQTHELKLVQYLRPHLPLDADIQRPNNSDMR